MLLIIGTIRKSLTYSFSLIVLYIYIYICLVCQIHMILQKAISAGTNRGYEPFEEVWLSFIESRFEGTDIFLSGWGEKDKRGVLVLFVDYLRGQRMSVSVGMAAVRHLFRSHLEDVSIFADACVQGAREACRPDPREVSLAKEQNLRLPVPFELIVELRRKFWEGSRDVDDRMTYLGIMLAYSLCLRVGEYAHDSGTKGKHCMRNDDIYFLCEDGVQRSPSELRLSQDAGVSSVMIIIRSSKTDTTGRGRYEYVHPVTTLHQQLLVDLTWWARNSLSGSGENFLSRYREYKGRLSHKVLTREMVSKALKAGATTLGIDASRISTHSLKIGGPSDMRAAGVGDEQIRRKTKHLSEASLGYQMASHKDIDPLAVASEKLGLTASDVQGLLPVKKKKNIFKAIVGEQELVLRLKRPKLGTGPSASASGGGGVTTSSSEEGTNSQKGVQGLEVLEDNP